MDDCRERAGPESFIKAYALSRKLSRNDGTMDLVNELQVSAEQDEVLTVLRKTKRLASKLGRQDIGQWLASELEGYKQSETIPAYRQIRATMAMNTNGFIPAGWGYVTRGIKDLPEFGTSDFPLRDSIARSCQ